MSFYDGISIASVFDGVELSDIVKLLRDHDIYVGQLIVNEREYLYYFIGDCNVLQQVAIRDEGTQRFHQEQNQLAKLPTSLLLFILKTCHPGVIDIMRTTHHFQQDLLRDLKKYDLQGLICERGWNTDDPTFIDSTSVATTLHVHHKDVISNALQFDFHQYLQERLQHPTFSDGIYVHEEYNLVTTPILQWLCREHIKDNTIPSRLTCADCLYHLQFPQ
ncbi:hypothetical protein F5146DRAFT_994603 [Armillaria mellea]|nr:hypothetical protein F5146DRAFT_994603 [Armillaria mellea]